MSSDERPKVIAEKWLPVQGTRYEISNYARLRNADIGNVLVRTKSIRVGDALRTPGALAVEAFGYIVQPAFQDLDPDFGPGMAGVPYCHRCVIRPAAVHQMIRSAKHEIAPCRYSLCERCRDEHHHGPEWEIVKEVPV